MTSRFGAYAFAAAIGCLFLAATPVQAFGPETTNKKSVEEAGAGAEPPDRTQAKEAPGMKPDPDAPEIGDQEPAPQDAQLTETQKMQKIRNEEIFANYATKEDLDSVLQSVREWQEYAQLIRLYGSLRLGVGADLGAAPPSRTSRRGSASGARPSSRTTPTSPPASSSA